MNMPPVNFGTKLCTGPAHPGPTRLPLDAEHWHFHRSGPRAGEPLSRCKLCRHWEEVADPTAPRGLVPAVTVRWLARELVERCGSAEQAAVRSGVTAPALRALVGYQTRDVQKRTVARILVALAEQRKSDRRNGNSERFQAARRAQAEREERITRLSGY